MWILEKYNDITSKGGIANLGRSHCLPCVLTIFINFHTPMSVQYIFSIAGFFCGGSDVYIYVNIYIYCSSFYHKVTVSWPQTISHRHIISWPQHLLMFLHLGFIPSGSNMCRRKRAPIYDLFHGEKGWNRMECDCFPYVYSDKSKWSKCLVSGYCNNPCWSMLIHVIIFIPSRDRHRRAPPSLSRPKSLRAGRSPLRMKHDEPPKFWLFDRESDD